MNTTESRVVELRFDNKEFEANAQQTINTLARLQQALDSNIDASAFDNLDRAARNVDLSGIQAGIDALTDRFSTMGIVGMTVIQNITNALTHTLGNTINNLLDTINTRGFARAQNIEKARFQLQGILGDASKVSEVMKNALDSVDGTAYALDEAARAASQLAASGVEAGDQMKSVLKGIAGVAATTSSDYEGISRIFTQIAGNGRVMGDQLLQLSNRGLNAAAELAKYFNAVAYEGKEASDAVKEQIAALTGASGILQDSTEAISEAAEASYDIAKKAADKEYKEKQKAYNKEYKALQKSLNDEYSLKKAAYDAEYKALQESLNAEVQAVQEANSKRIEELQEKYQADVEAYREATDQKIALINEEYTESIKLIDEERYNKLKAVQDQIDAINEQAKAEQKALKDQANAEKKAELESILNNARNNKTKQQAAQVLADFEAELAREQLAEDRANQIEDLQNQKTKINEEAQEKKEEAQKKAQSAKEAVQTESNAELKAMQKAHQAELTQLRKEQNEQVEAMREANSTRLQLLRESQTEELSIYKEGQTDQLEAFREKQQEELELFKENQNEMLEALKDTGGKASKYASQFGGTMAVTEADIRQMVSDGLISFDIFSEAMASTFGDHAFEANKTFEGVMANIRAALAKTGALFYSPLIEQEGPLVEFLNAVRVKITEFNKALAPVAHYVAELINHILPLLQEKVEGITFKAADFYHVWRGIYAIGEYLVSIFKAIGDGFEQALDVDAEPIKNSAREFRTFAESLKLTEKNSSNISKIAKAIIKSFKALFSIVKRLAKAFSPLLKVFGSTVDTVLDLDGGIADVIIKFADWIETSQGVQKFFDGLTSVMRLFSDTIINVKNAIRRLAIDTDAFNVGKNFIQGFIEGVKSVVATVYEYISSFCLMVLQKVKSIFGIESPSKVMFEYGVYIIQGLINGIKSLADKAGTILVDVFEKILKTIKEKFGNITETIKELASSINSRSVNMNGEEIGTSFISEFISGVINHLPNPIEKIKEFFGKMKDGLLNPNVGTPVGSGFMSGFLEGAKEALSKIVEKVKSLFFKISEKITGYFNSSSDINGEESGENFILSFIKGLKDTIGDKAGDVIGSIGDAFGKIKDNLPSLQVIGIAAGSLAGIILLVKSVKSGFLANIIKPFLKLSKVFKIINFAKKKDQIMDFISGLTQSGSDIAGNLNDGFVAGIQEKIKGALEAAKQFASKILQAIKDVFGIASPAKSMIEIGKNLVETLVNTIVTYSKLAWDKITDIFSGLLDKIKELFEKGFGIIEEHGSQLLSLATGLGVLLLIIKLTKQMDKIVLPFKKVSGVLTGFKKALNGIAWDLKGTAILKFASAFAILVASLSGLIWVAQNLDDPQKLTQVLAGFITLLIAFTAATYAVISALEKLSKSKMTVFTQNPKDNALVVLAQGVKQAIKQWSFGNMVKSFAKSVATLVASFFALIQIIKNNDQGDIDQAKQIMLGMASFLAIMTVILAFISHESQEQVSVLGVLNNTFTQLSLGFFLLAATVWVIVKSLEDLVNMNVDLTKHKDKIGLLIGIFAALSILMSVVMYASYKAQHDGKDLKISASPLIAFCLMLLATLHVLKKVLSLDLSGEDTLDKIRLFRNIFIAVGILAVVLMAISAKAQGTVKAGGTIIALCLFMYAAAGAVALLGHYKPETLIKGIISLIFIMIACAIALSAASGIQPASFKTVLAVIAMLAVVVAAVAAISFGNWKDYVPGTVMMCVVLLCIAAVFSQLAKVNSKDGAGKIWAMVVALGLIAAGLWAVSLHPWERILLAGIAISAVLLVYAKVFKDIAKTKVNGKSVGAFIVGCISIAVIGGILTALATQDWGSILSAGIAISLVLYTYGEVFKEISQVQANPAATLNFLVGSLSIAVIGGILTAVATQEWGSILSAGVAIALVIEAYGDVFSKIGEAKTTTGQAINFVIGSVAVAIIGGILTAVATQDWSSILSAGATVALCIEAYADAYKKIEGVHIEMEDVFNFIMGALSLVLIGLSIGVASQNDWSSILAAGTAISEVLLAYKAVYKDLQGVDLELGDVGKFLVGAVAVAIIGAVLYGVAQNDWQSILSAGGSISLVLEAMADAIKIINGIEISWSGFGALVGGLVAVAAVGYILHQASTDTNWQDMLGTAVSICTVLLGLCIVLGILSFVGEVAPAAGVGILLLDGLIADLAAVLVALGALTEYTAFEDLVKSGQSTLIMLGEALGNFFGAIVKGTMDFIGMGIEDLGTSLSNFMTNAKPFFDGLKEIDDSMIASAKALVGIMLEFAVAELVDSISNIFNVFGLFTPDFATKFATLGEALAKFDEKTKGISGWNVKNAAEAVDILIGVGDKVGLLDAIESKLLPGYAADLAGFAEKMPTIVANLGDIGKTTYENAAGAMTTMIDIMDHIKSRDFRDAEDLPTFGEQITKFAGFIRSAGKYGADMNITDFANLSTCAQEVIGIAKVIPYQQNGSSLLGLISGDNDIGDFGRKVLSFAKFMGGKDGIETYAKDLDPVNFNNLYNSAYWVLQIATAIPYQKSGLSALFSGNNDISSFGAKLKSFTISMVAINKYLETNELNHQKFVNLKNITIDMLDIVDKLKELYDSSGSIFKKDFTAGNALKDFGKALEDFGKNVKECGKKATDGYLGFSGAIELLQKLQDMMPDLESFTGKSVTDFLKNLKQYGIDGLSNFLDSFTNSQEAVNKAIGTMFSNMSTAFTGKRDLMISLGRVIVGYFITGIGENNHSVEDAAKEIASKFRSAISDSSDFKQAGRDAGQGFADGIRDKIDDARQAGGSLGRAAYNAARKALDENSPSKKMMEVGSFGGEGFVNGLMSWIRAASNTGEELGYSATDSLKEALNNLGKEIQNEELINPVITPILDLSNVEDNASAINGLLNLDKPIALAANAGMSFTGGLNNLLSNIQASIPDNTNDDVVASINGLRDDLNILSTRVANLQVVMDSGELVGAIAPAVDDQLGWYQVLAERGVR